MKIALILLVVQIPLMVFGQKKTEYYENGVVKSIWKTDVINKTDTNYYYYPNGNLKAIGVFDKNNKLKEHTYFKLHGGKVDSKPVKLSDQPKTDLSFIHWKFNKSGLGYYFENNPSTGVINNGDHVYIWYVGYFEDGSQFDNCDLTGTLLETKVGEGKFIRGFEQGLLLFKKGQKGYLLIPPELGYGKAKLPTIPPNSKLIYKIEVF